MRFLAAKPRRPGPRAGGWVGRVGPPAQQGGPRLQGTACYYFPAMDHCFSL